MRVAHAGWRIVGAGAMVVAALVACGGSDGGEDALALRAEQPTVASGSADGDSQSIPSLERTAELLQEGAQLNSRELDAAAAVGETVEALGKSKAIGAEQKSFAGRIQAYRFYNTQTGAHFYTVSTSERDYIIATLPQFNYEGPAFFASAVAAPGLSQVHRFYNVQTGVHFYTINENERATILQTMPQFRYEGVAYYASRGAGAGLTPLHRFYVANLGFHFYSNNEAETNSIRNNPALANYQYEGVGYHVLSDSYAGRMIVLPHTGVSSTQCHQLGSNTRVDCNSLPGQGLYVHQDGHRVNINPAMNYSEVLAPAGGTYPRTECVRDTVTGLVWEGKNATEPRSSAAVYTYANIPAYVNYVNGIALCGYTNWRLPTRHELLSIVHYGISTEPKLHVEWFPNTRADYYWTASPYVGGTNRTWVVDFDGGLSHSTGTFANTSQLYVRLVRHEP